MEWSCNFSKHPVSSPLLGIFIESRPDPKIKEALTNFSCMLPYASLYIMYSKSNKDIIENTLGGFLDNISFEELPEPFTGIECNLLKLSKEFWRKFKNFNRILIFNIDTGIRVNTVLRFMKWDYIGAMWYHNPCKDPRIYQGNGGFSLRNPRLMYDVLDNFPSTHDNTKDIIMPEDVWFCMNLVRHFKNAKLPPPHECELFSTETKDLSGTFGYHNVDYWIPNAQKAYKVRDGPKQNLIDVYECYLDGIINVTDLVKLGVGPNGLRIFKETDFRAGKMLNLKTNIGNYSIPTQTDFFIRIAGKDHVFYRFSDLNNGNIEKPRPEGFCKRKNFENFLKFFKNSTIHVIADKVSEKTLEWLYSKVNNIEITNIGNGGDVFCFVLNKVLELEDNDNVYLVEDDYEHWDNAEVVLKEGLNISDYITLYDHPDKYISNGPNPLVINEGEITLIRKTTNSHWKFTNSTTLTFAARVGTLRQDYNTHIKWCKDGKSLDFTLFRDLIENQGRTLACAIPGKARHLNKPWDEFNTNKYHESSFSAHHT